LARAFELASSAHDTQIQGSWRTCF